MTATSTRYFYSFVLGAMTSTVTFAQAVGPSSTGAAAAEPLQEVVVTGIRHSIEQALDIKRDSINVVDSIATEDLGKLPDQNVAESLQRITNCPSPRLRSMVTPVMRCSDSATF